MQMSCSDNKAKVYNNSVRPKWEIANIFSKYGEIFRSKHKLPLSHLKVMRDIELCRTAYLGGHLDKCSNCGHEKPSYNSCSNRHCPKCQSLNKAKWLEARKAELLPVQYFHNVFTLPHELNPLILRNKQVIFDILFKSVSITLQKFGRNNLLGSIGFTAILHTWCQTLLDHFHLHCVIPGGVLSLDRKNWIHSRKKFLFPIKALSKTFRKYFIYYLEKSFSAHKLVFQGNIAYLKCKTKFKHLISLLLKKNWIVYSKKPFAGPEQVLNYLGRYTHRVAISNNRITNVKNNMVTFKYQDRKNNKSKTMTLNSYEFIRRFLLHVLPDSFMRIRHFGFLSNRCKNDNLSCLRQILNVSSDNSIDIPKSTSELIIELTGIDPKRCPCCKQLTMMTISELPKMTFSLWKIFKPQILDSS